MYIEKIKKAKTPTKMLMRSGEEREFARLKAIVLFVGY